MSGWIKLHRKLQTSDMFKNLNSKQRDVMIQLIFLANHEPHEWEWKGKIHKVKRGQCVTSLDSLKKLCASDVSFQNIRTALVKLEKWQFLTNESTKTGRLITVLNYDTYQNKEIELNKAINKQLTNDQQTANKQLTTNKNNKEGLKKDKEKKKGDFKIIIYPFDSKKFMDTWDLWKEFRIENRWGKYKPIGEQAALRDIAKLSNGNENIAIEIINKSISKGWRGLFELKENQIKMNLNDGELTHDQKEYLKM